MGDERGIFPMRDLTYVIGPDSPGHFESGGELYEHLKRKAKGSITINATECSGVDVAHVRRTGEPTMIDDPEDDDTPDIPPALTSDQWSMQAYSVGTFVDGLYRSPGATIALSVDPGTDNPNQLIVAKDGHTIVFRDASELVALVALANAAMHDEDPRKFTRSTVEMLRIAAQCIDEDTPVPIDENKMREKGNLYSELFELADVIESYLPPVDSK